MYSPTIYDGYTRMFEAQLNSLASVGAGCTRVTFDGERLIVEDIDIRDIILAMEDNAEEHF